MRKDDIKRLQSLSPSRWLSIGGIRSMRCGLVAGFAILTIIILVSTSTRPVLSLALGPSSETRVPPSPTPVQVTPPPTGTTSGLPTSGAKREPLREVGELIRMRGWLLTFAGGILAWAVGGVVLVAIAVLLILVVRRRSRRLVAPPPTASIPFLKSSDGSLYFRLDRLNEDGLIIGRDKHGVDLRIEESIPNVDTVSNHHARIYYDPASQNVIIEDLSSTNGIFINGRRAPRKNLLKDGWVVSLGEVTMTYYDGESDTGPLD